MIKHGPVTYRSKKKTMGKVRKEEVPWPPRHNYLVNSDICTGSRQSAMFSACYNGKSHHVIGCKITTTKKLSVLDLWVVNLAFVACGKYILR